MKTKKIVRLSCGVLMLVYSAMMVFDLLPSPKTPEAAALLGALIDAGYFYPMIYSLYAVIGTCFLANRFVSLATLALIPISLNVVLYHAVLSPKTLPVVLSVLAAAGVDGGHTSR